MQMSVGWSVCLSVSFLIFSTYEATSAMQHDADEDGDADDDEEDDDDEEYDDNEEEDDDEKDDIFQKYIFFIFFQIKMYYLIVALKIQMLALEQLQNSRDADKMFSIH